MLPTPATRILSCRSPPGLDLVGREVAEAAVRELQLGGRVPVDGHRDVHAAVDVVHAPPARWRRIPSRNRSWTSPPRPGPQHHAAALGHRARRRPAPSRCPGRRRRPARVPPRQPLAGASARAVGAERLDARHCRRAAGGASGSRRAAAPGSPAACASTASMMPGRPRVGGPGLGLLLVGQRQRAQREDLVVLQRRRRGRSCSPGRAAGGRARMIGEDSTRSLRSLGPASTGQVCSELTHSWATGSAHCGGSVSERNVPADAASMVCAAISDVPQHLLARRAGRALAVVHRRRAAAGSTRYGPGRSVADTHTGVTGQHSRRRAQPTSRRGVADLLGLPRRGQPDRDGQLACEQVVEASHRGVDLPRHALLEPQSSGCRRRPAPDRCTGRGPRRAGLELQEPQPDVQYAPRRGRRFQQHLGAVARWARCRRRSAGEHAELPAQPVLLRRRPVGVEQIALEQHGVGHRASSRATASSSTSTGLTTRAVPASSQRRLRAASGLVPGRDRPLRAGTPTARRGSPR